MLPESQITLLQLWCQSCILFSPKMDEKADTVFLTPDGRTISVATGKPIGSGRYGTVYLAQFAVFVPQKQNVWQTCAVKYCMRSAELARILSLKHPNLVQFLHYGDIPGNCATGTFNYCIAMEYCKDGTLSAKAAKRNEPLSLPTIINYTLQILRGLDHLHSHRIIHKDLKGENIFLTANFTVVKIGDIDDHTAIEGLNTKTNDIVTTQGTWKWMSPEMVLVEFEQASKNTEQPNSKLKVGRATDIWSLGCVVLEMLTQGTLTIVSADGKTTIRNYKHLSLAATNGGFFPYIPEDAPDQIKSFLKRCLQKESKLRPSTENFLYGPEELFDEKSYAVPDFLSSESNIKELPMPSLGREFQLGSLYDARTDYLSLATPLIDAKIELEPLQSHHCDVIDANARLRDKFDGYRMRPEQQLSLISGLFETSGASQYLFDLNPYSKRHKIAVALRVLTRHERLSLRRLCQLKEPFLSSCERARYTHFVTGITYGYESVLVFDLPVNYSKNKRDEIREIIKKHIRDGFKPIDTANFIKDLQTKVRAFSGTASNEQIRSTFYYNIHLHKEESEDSIPIKVWLCPLNAIDSEAENYYKPIRPTLIDEVFTIEEELTKDRIRISNMLEEPVNYIFPFLKLQIVYIIKLLEHYCEHFFKSRLHEVVPRVRTGTNEPNELEEIINSHRRSQFDKASLDGWCNNTEKLQELLKDLLTQIKGSEFITILGKAEEVAGCAENVRSTTCVLQFLFSDKELGVGNSWKTLATCDNDKKWTADETVIAHATYLIRCFCNLAKKHRKEEFRFLVDPNTKLDTHGKLTVTDAMVRIVVFKGQSEFCIQNPEFMRLDNQSPVGATFIGANIIVAGGNRVEAGYHSTVELFCPDLNKWTAFPSLPTERSGAGAAFLNGKIYIIGGYNSIRDGLTLTNLTFAEGGTKWIEMEHKLNLQGPTSVVAAFGSLYRHTLDENEKKWFWRLDPRENSWIKLASPIFKLYDSSSMAKLGNYVYACGGFDENAKMNVERYEIRMDRWETVQAMQQGIANFRAASDDNYLYAIGGLERDCERFDPSLNQWEILPKINSLRFGHCVAVTGNDLYAIGGYQHKTVEMFKPVTKEWSFCSPMSVERYLACAVVIPSDFYTPSQ